MEVYSLGAELCLITVLLSPAAEIYFDDINLDKDYTPQKAYKQSKLANVLFSRELSKRLQGKPHQLPIKSFCPRCLFF